MAALTKARRFFFVVLVAMIVVAAITLALDALVHYAPVQRYLIARISDQIGHDLQAETFRISYRGGLGISARKVRVVARTGDQRIDAAQVDIAFGFRDLLRRKITPTAIFIEHPDIWLRGGFAADPGSPSSTVGLTADDLAALLSGPLLSDLPKIQITKGHLRGNGLIYQMEDLLLKIEASRDSRYQKRVAIRGVVRRGEDRVPVYLSGLAGPVDATHDDLSLDMKLVADDLPLAWAPWHGAVRFEGGSMPLQLALNGTLSQGFTIRADIRTSNIHLSVNRRGRQHNYRVNAGRLRLDGRVQQRLIDIVSFGWTTPQFTLDGSFRLEDDLGRDPRFDLSVKSPDMTLAVFKELVPYPLLPRWLEETLFPLFQGGFARINHFGLNGRISEIVGLGKRANAGAIAVDVSLRDLVALADSGGRPIDAVSGRIRISQGGLEVSKVGGRWGQSLLSDGQLTLADLYDRQTPMRIALDTDLELKDLLPQREIDLLPQQLRSALAPVVSAAGRLQGSYGMQFDRPGLALARISGDLDISAAVIDHSLWHRPLSIASGRIRMGGDGENRIDLNGGWSQSTFELSGRFDPIPAAPNRFLPDGWALSIASQLDLTDLGPLKDQQGLPPPLRGWLAGLTNASGQADIQLELAAGNEAGQTAVLNALTVKCADSRLAHRKAVFGFQIDTGQLTYSPAQGHRFSVSALWGQTVFDLSGYADGRWSKYQMSGSSRLDLKQILSEFVPDVSSRIEVAGALPGSFRIAGGAQGIGGSGRVFLKGVRLNAGPFAFSAYGAEDMVQVEWRRGADGIILLENCRLLAGDSKIDASGRFGPRRGEPFAFTLIAAPLRLQDLSVYHDGDPVAYTGEINGQVEIAGPADGPDLRGRLTARQLHLPDAPFPGSVPGIEADIELGPERLQIKKLVLPFDPEPIRISGDLDNWQQPRGRLQVSTTLLDLPAALRLWRSEKQKRPRQPSGTALRKADITVTVRASRVFWEGIDLGPLAARGHLINGTLQVPRVDLRSAAATVDIQGQIPLSAKTGTSFASHFNLRKVPVAALLKGFGIQKERITGTLSTSGELIAKETGVAALMPRLNGNLNFQIDEGELFQSHIVLKVLDFLSLQNIFRSRPPEISRKQFYFERFKGRLLVKDGIVEAEDVYLKSPIFNAAITGSVNLVDKGLMLKLGAEPLGTIDLLVSRIPIIGHILTGDKKALLVYYFEIKGTIDDPRVVHVPLQHLPSGVAGYISRLLLTPYRLVQQTGKVLDNITQNLKDNEPKANKFKAPENDR